MLPRYRKCRFFARFVYVYRTGFISGILTQYIKERKRAYESNDPTTEKGIS
jgi:hypothetical protein